LTKHADTARGRTGSARHSFSAVFGAVIASVRAYRETFRLRPGFDLAAEGRARDEAGEPEKFGEGDLYPDARPCLTALRSMGLRIGVAGNQTAQAGRSCVG
jgi:hypothetical protein